jgi:hypothetical protein
MREHLKVNGVGIDFALCAFQLRAPGRGPRRPHRPRVESAAGARPHQAPRRGSPQFTAQRDVDREFTTKIWSAATRVSSRLRFPPRQARRVSDGSSKTSGAGVILLLFFSQARAVCLAKSGRCSPSIRRGQHGIRRRACSPTSLPMVRFAAPSAWWAACNRAAAGRARHPHRVDALTPLVRSRARRRRLLGFPKALALQRVLPRSPLEQLRSTVASSKRGERGRIAREDGPHVSGSGARRSLAGARPAIEVILRPCIILMMIVDLHYWPTPNGWKVSIMLAEETGLPYRLGPCWSERSASR